MSANNEVTVSEEVGTNEGTIQEIFYNLLCVALNCQGARSFENVNDAVVLTLYHGPCHHMKMVLFGQTGSRNPLNGAVLLTGTSETW